MLPTDIHELQIQPTNPQTNPDPENQIVGSSPTFDSTGILYADANITHDAGQTHQVVGFFVEEYVESGDVARAIYHYNDGGYF